MSDTYHRITYRFVRTLTRVVRVREGEDKEALFRFVADTGTGMHYRAGCAFYVEPDRAEVLGSCEVDPATLPEDVRP